MLKKNDILIETAADLSYEGNGIIKPEGFVLFVRGLLDHEKAKVAVTKVGKTQGYGRILEILSLPPSGLKTTARLIRGAEDVL